jgi:hypothetical protein
MIYSQQYWILYGKTFYSAILALLLKPHCIRCSHFKVDEVSALEASAKLPFVHFTITFGRKMSSFDFWIGWCPVSLAHKHKHNFSCIKEGWPKIKEFYEMSRDHVLTWGYMYMRNQFWQTKFNVTMLCLIRSKFGRNVDCNLIHIPNRLECSLHQIVMKRFELWLSKVGQIKNLGIIMSCVLDVPIIKIWRWSSH